MTVGDTHTIQALNGSGQSIKGLAWTSTDPTLVSLSTDDPPVLTALAIGRVTISAGGASADVTVSPTLSPGALLWSNPGDGSGVKKIVPAVPSSTGVADVFAFQNDGTVQAITSDGTTAWTAQASGGIPDFQGGLIVSKFDFNTDSFSIQKLDGLTGQPYPAYSSAIPASAVYPDGAVLIADTTSSGTVIGIDPISGTQKFAVTVNAFDAFFLGGQPIIAGDGYAYVPHADQAPGSCCVPVTLKMLRVNSSGAYDDIPIYSFITIPEVAVSIYTITNADEGVLVSWNTCETSGPSNPCQSVSRMAMLTGTSVSGLNPPQMPGQSQPIIPVLQAQDGSYIGTAGNAMIAFDQTGNLRWSVAGDWQPQIATADGGLIATLLDDNTGNAIGTYTFDQNGNTTGQPQASIPYSWDQQWYSVALGQIAEVAGPTVQWAISYGAALAGNPSANGTYIGVAEEVEGMPVFALPLRCGPSCQPPSGASTKAPLSGTALSVYNSEKTQLFSGNYLTSASCSAFFNDPTVPSRAPYFNQLTAAVNAQVPYDGAQTTIANMTQVSRTERARLM
jgi:hypothetical protein